MNDVDSDLLENEEGQSFINLGANALSVQSAHHLYDQFAGIFPVREVVFAADPLEMRDAIRANVDVPTAVLRRYVLGKMTIAEEFTYRDISGLDSYWRNWRKFHSAKDPNSLVFSKTGDVPLEINQANADPEMWNGDTIDADIACTHCTDALAAFCSDVRSQGRAFTLVLGPVREGVLERYPEVRDVDDDRRARIQAVLDQCGGKMFDITQYFVLSDACFANAVHLNANGMQALTAQFERFRRGETLAKGASLPCGGFPVSAAANPREPENVRSHLPFERTSAVHLNYHWLQILDGLGVLGAKPRLVYA